ncbi:MAG: DUF3794 domain-containing protein [Lachnospiraceae bacterium]|nr:DUF3794 domain-containing protein [Lachnospiraceae bacterium]
MNLEKRLLRMDRMKYRASTQIALEDDRNLQDNKPDIAEILCQKGKICLDEVKTVSDHVTLKGKLQYEVLYRSDERGAVCSLEGMLPFEEQIYMENVQPEDLVQVKSELEDLTIGMINSRKLSIQALAVFVLFVEELYDQSLPVAIEQTSDLWRLETRKRSMDAAEIKAQKKDIYRIKETIELPQNMPNIGSLVWKDITISELEFKAVDEKIFMKGEMKVFLLYEADNDTDNTKVFTTTIPVNGILDCQGCRSSFVPEIRYQIKEEQVDVQDDFDGEARVLSLEMVLDLYIKLYEELKLQIIDDCYGIGKDAEMKRRKMEYKSSLLRCVGKCKVQEMLKDDSLPENCIVLHGQGTIQKESEELTEKGVDILGAVFAEFLLTDMDGKLYRVRNSMPFHYLLEAASVPVGSISGMEMKIENLNLSKTGDGWETKGAVGFELVTFKPKEEEFIEEIILTDPDTESLKKAPCMVGYIVKAGDTLWSVGKKYGVSLDGMKQINDLNGEIKTGDKILIIR